MKVTHEDQQKYNKAMQQATTACDSAYRVRGYFAFIKMLVSVSSNPARRKQAEAWEATALHAYNVTEDAKKTLSAAYDVMLKWEQEDEDEWRMLNPES